MTMTRQNVINKTTKQVLRFGFCDFQNDGSFDAVNESVIISNKPVALDWYWHEETLDFKEIAP